MQCAGSTRTTAGSVGIAGGVCSVVGALASGPVGWFGLGLVGTSILLKVGESVHSHKWTKAWEADVQKIADEYKEVLKALAFNIKKQKAAHAGVGDDADEVYADAGKDVAETGVGTWEKVFEELQEIAQRNAATAATSGADAATTASEVAAQSTELAIDFVAGGLAAVVGLWDVYTGIRTLTDGGSVDDALRLRDDITDAQFKLKQTSGILV